jgi:sulfate/thiosulfate transport system ATP-binding protein
VEKQFGRYPALNGVSLDVRPGELLALLGPSGSGKTTLLRLIAGLDFADAGEVCFDDRDVTATPAGRREIGFVFQQYALFRHMTVAANIAFGLDVKPRRARLPKAERRARVEELLELVELKGLGDRYPAQLSGGQRQRVALARALAASPRILLLDEPFGALDATVRRTLRHELLRIHRAAKVTTVFVTHDQEEALDLADRVAILNGGRIEQIDTPDAVLERPASAFVAGFVGQSNRVPGWVRDGVFTRDGLHLPAPDLAAGPAAAFIRPDQLAPAEHGLAVAVVRATARGGMTWLDCLTADGRRLEAALPRADAAESLGAGAAIHLQAKGGRIFPAEPQPGL